MPLVTVTEGRVEAVGKVIVPLEVDGVLPMMIGTGSGTVVGAGTRLPNPVADPPGGGVNWITVVVLLPTE